MALAALVGIATAVALTLPFAAKWQLGVRRVAVSVAGLGIAAAIVVLLLDRAVGLPSLAVSGLVVALDLAAALAILAYRFYRDPERTPPSRDDVIVSPADGEVVYVREVKDGRVPVSTKHGRDYALDELTGSPLGTDDALVIGIGMSFLDVHVNRAPIAGRVLLRRHFPGLFGSLRDPEMVFRNERATTIIERSGLQVAVVQIASRLVRQIASYVRENERVELGQRIGVIRLGSQVDVVVPVRAGARVVVEEGQRVSAGESVLVELGG
jgi:phosphatidylserine decarboxylase